MAGDASWAIELPGMFNPERQAENLAQSKRYREQQSIYEQRRRDAERNDAIVQVNRLTEPKDYQTGDAVLDNHISDLLSNATNEAYDQIRRGADFSTVMQGLRLKTDGIGKLHTSVKSGLSNIDKEAAMVAQKFPSVNAVKLREAARKRLLYDGDKLRTDYSTLDPNMGYISKSLEENPEDFVEGTGYLSKVVQGSKMQPVGSTETKEYAGKKVKYGFKGQINPLFENLEVDDNGTPRIKFRTESIDLPGMPGGPKPKIEMLDQNAFGNLIKDPNAALEFKAYYNRWKKQKGLDNEEYGVADDQLQRAAALDFLGGNGQRITKSYISPIMEQTNSNFRSKMEAGVPLSQGSSGPKIPDNNPVKMWAEFSNPNSPTSTSFIPPTTEYKGEQVKDLTTLLGGLKFGEKEAVNGIYQHPDNTYTVIFKDKSTARKFVKDAEPVDDVNGAAVRLTPQQQDQLMSQISPMNGIGPVKSQAIQPKSQPSSGKTMSIADQLRANKRK